MAALSTEEIAAAISSGDRRALARGITLVESSREDHRNQAIDLLELLAGQAGGALRVAISGTPGVGKSTFIENLGKYAIADGNNIAVLAIDPSSTFSGGSILGDKTRMPSTTQTNADNLGDSRGRHFHPIRSQSIASADPRERHE